MAGKYYAVRNGKKVGIFKTWDECKEQVVGYSGAIYKSFKTMEEAARYMEGEGINNQRVKNEIIGSSATIRQDDCEIFAYIDGSFEKSLDVVGYGGVIITPKEEIEFSKGTKDKRYTQFWNVAGELLAAGEVVKFALQNNYKSCALYYDCTGIEFWAKGQWKTNNELTARYKDFMQKSMKEIKIEFYKVRAHSGVSYNERADQLAKKGTRQV